MKIMLHKYETKVGLIHSSRNLFSVDFIPSRGGQIFCAAKFFFVARQVPK